MPTTIPNLKEVVNKLVVVLKKDETLAPKQQQDKTKEQTKNTTAKSGS